MHAPIPNAAPACFSVLTLALLANASVEAQGLQDLSFYKTRLTDEVLKHLEGLSGLQNLTLPDPGTSEAAVAKLRKVLTKCEITKLDY